MADTLKKLYSGWRYYTFGKHPTCPGCFALLPTSGSPLIYYLNRINRRISVPTVHYCGREECLHVVWDAREYALLEWRKTLRATADRLFNVCQICDTFKLREERCPVCALWRDADVSGLGSVSASYRRRITKYRKHGDYSRPYSYKPRYTKGSRAVISSALFTGTSRYWKIYYSRNHRRIFIWKQE